MSSIGKHFIYDSTTKKVLRWGFSPMDSDGVFNSETESCVEKDVILSPDIDKQDWYYNESTQLFQQTQP